MQTNLEKRYFRKKDLKSEDIDFLLSKNYVISSHVSLGGGQREDYLLKPNEDESAGHFFLIKAVEEYLKLYTKDINLYETKKPDIIFTANGKKWAFEIETGTTITKNPPQFFKKVGMLKKEFGKNWIFIVTKSELSYAYNRFGKTYTRKNIERKIRSIFKKTSPPKTRPKKAAILGGKNQTKKTTKKEKSRRRIKKSPSSKS